MVARNAINRVLHGSGEETIPNPPKAPVKFWRATDDGIEPRVCAECDKAFPLVGLLPTWQTLILPSDHYRIVIPFCSAECLRAFTERLEGKETRDGV